jgi:hypothetical protein
MAYFMRHPDVVLVAQEIQVGVDFWVVDNLKEVLAKTFLRTTTDDQFFDTPFFLVGL